MIPRLLELAQESATPARFERGVLELFGREIGFDVATFTTRGDEGRPTAVGLDREMLALTVAHTAVYGRELLPVKRHALSRRGVAVDTDVLGVELVRRQRYFNEVASRVNGRHSLFVLVRWRGQVAAAILLGRTGSAFSEREVRRLEDALPALATARAVYGFPTPVEPLPNLSHGGISARLGLPQRVRVRESVQTPTGMLSVRDRTGFREMVATTARAELVWTRVDLQDSGRSGWPYVEFFHLAAALAKERRRALFIGAGGAVALRQFARVYPGIELDVVERESAVIELARTWFDLGAIPGLTVHVDDGAAFVQRAALARDARWDIVVIDAYDAADIAAPFTKPAFFAALRRILSPGAAVALNLIAPLGPLSPLHDLLRTLETEFSELRVIPVISPGEVDTLRAPRNLVVIAQVGRR